MAELARICIDGFCTDNTKYTAGNNITITDGVISASVDLSNYYNKSEVNDLIDGIQNAQIVVVDELPATGETNTIYLVPKDPAGESGNIYDEYVYASGNYEKIGDTEIDLSDYYTKEQADAKYLTCESLADCDTFQTVVTEVAGKQNTLTAGDNIQINGNTISATDTTYGNATTETAGLMSATDKEKLDSLTPDDYLTCGTVGSCETISSMADSVEELKSDFGKKQNRLVAGDNITIVENADNTETISATNQVTKAAILSALGYEETTISMTDENGVSHTWNILAKEVTA